MKLKKKIETFCKTAFLKGNRLFHYTKILARLVPHTFEYKTTSTCGLQKIELHVGGAHEISTIDHSFVCHIVSKNSSLNIHISYGVTYDALRKHRHIIIDYFIIMNN